MSVEKIPDLTELTEPALPDEEPIGITKPNVSMTKTPTPKGTFYNKNIVLMMLFAILLAFGIVIVLSMSFGRKKISNSQTGPQGDQQTALTQAQDLTPAEIGKISGSYGRTGSGNGSVFSNKQGSLDQDGERIQAAVEITVMTPIQFRCRLRSNPSNQVNQLSLIVGPILNN